MGSTRHTTQCCADFAGILAAGGLPRCDFDASLLPAEVFADLPWHHSRWSGLGTSNGVNDISSGWGNEVGADH